VGRVGAQLAGDDGGGGEIPSRSVDPDGEVAEEGEEEAVGVRWTSAASEVTLARRRSAVGRGRNVQWLGASEKKKMRLFFLREGIRLVHPCVGPGRTLDRELLGEPFPGRCVLSLMKQSEGCQIFYFGKIYKF
jgi:hypothetical protein